MKKADTTIKAVQDGLTEMGAAKGIKNIDSWLEALETAEFRGAKTIHGNLAKLKKHLENEELDSKAITELLHTLGEETKRAAGHEDNAHTKKIAELGELLATAGGTGDKKK